MSENFEVHAHLCRGSSRTKWRPYPAGACSSCFDLHNPGLVFPDKAAYDEFVKENCNENGHHPTCDCKPCRLLKPAPADGSYDSTEETKAHIKRVHELVKELHHAALSVVLLHDQSKLIDPEKEIFDKFTPLLKDSTYGSDEYKEFLAAMKPALDHHYKENRHHPEHFENGVNGMTLLDLIEMFCDWKAATERHKDGSLEKSIQHNAGRFKIGEQLTSIFENTRNALGW